MASVCPPFIGVHLNARITIVDIRICGTDSAKAERKIFKKNIKHVKSKYKNLACEKAKLNPYFFFVYPKNFRERA